MSCNLPIENGVRNASDCKCYGAVMKTFRALDTEPPHIALEAAQRVYRYHHPEDTKQDAHLTVERWITADRHVH